MTPDQCWIAWHLTHIPTGPNKHVESVIEPLDTWSLQKIQGLAEEILQTSFTWHAETDSAKGTWKETDVLCLRKIRRHCTLQARRFFGDPWSKMEGQIQNPQMLWTFTISNLESLLLWIVSTLTPSWASHCHGNQQTPSKTFGKTCKSVIPPRLQLTKCIHYLWKHETPPHSSSGGEKWGKSTQQSGFGPQSVEAQNEIPGKNLGGNLPYTPSRQSWCNSCRHGKFHRVCWVQ